MDAAQNIGARADLRIFKISLSQTLAGEQIDQACFEVGGPQIQGHPNGAFWIFSNKINQFTTTSQIIDYRGSTKSGLPKTCGHRSHSGKRDLYLRVSARAIFSNHPPETIYIGSVILKARGIGLYLNEFNKR